MDHFVYHDILEEKMVPHADNNMPLLYNDNNMPLLDNDPKRTSKFVKQCLKRIKLN